MGGSCRNLADFLYKPKADDDDALAEQFFDVGEWKRLRPSKPSSFPKLKKRANKELAHLTYFRLGVASKDKPWDVIPLTKDLVHPLQVFVERVPRNRVSELFLQQAPVHLSAVAAQPEGGGVATGLAGP